MTKREVINEVDSNRDNSPNTLRELEVIVGKI